jgi:AcrR family transcriptional regulator
MVYSASQLIRRGGVAATGMRDVVAHAEAPRGSLQHYFPGGKDQLTAEAARWGGLYAAKQVGRFMASLATPALDSQSPGALFEAMARQLTDELPAEGYAAGCPVAASVVDCSGSSETVRAAAAEAFAMWRDAVAAALGEMRVPPERAEPLAALMISALEGAILMARSERDTRALDAVVAELRPLLDAAVEP